MLLRRKTTAEPLVDASLLLIVFLVYICFHRKSRSSLLLCLGADLLQHVHKSIKLVDVFLVDAEFLWQRVQVFRHRLRADVK